MLASWLNTFFTPKAFANSQPRLRFGNPGNAQSFPRRRNSEEVALAARRSEIRRNSFRVATRTNRPYSQGFKANPGLKLANAFSVFTGSPSARTHTEVCTTEPRAVGSNSG